MSEINVMFLIDKGLKKSDLTQLRKEICDRYIKNKSYKLIQAEDAERDRNPSCYEASVTTWHAQRASIYERMIREELADGQHGAFLVWGDPSLYDSTLRILDQVIAMKTVAFDLDVIPGITSAQALAARHRIALNRIGEPVHITTGRQLAKGMTTDNVVVMLDNDCAFKNVKVATSKSSGARMSARPTKFSCRAGCRNAGRRSKRSGARRERATAGSWTYISCERASERIARRRGDQQNGHFADLLQRTQHIAGLAAESAVCKAKP